MRSIAVLALVVATLGARAPVRAQEASTPEAFAPAYFAAMRAADWDRVATLMHPEALAQFKGMFRELVAADTSHQLLQLFGLPDTAAYAKAPAQRLFATFMKSVAGSIPELTGVLATAAIETIGHVDEAKTGLTFVVFRMRANLQGVSVTKLDVLPLKRSGSGWGAMLTGDMEGIAAAMRRQLAR